MEFRLVKTTKGYQEQLKFIASLLFSIANILERSVHDLLSQATNDRFVSN